MPRARARLSLAALLAVIALAIRGAAPGGAGEPAPAAPTPTAHAAAAAWPRTLTDDLGRAVTIPAPPARIVSTAPSNTEALYALGAGGRVVGVTSYCKFPEAAQALPKIGDFSTIDFERVLALRPDLVVATGLEQRRHVAKLESLGLRVFVVFPSGIDGVLRSLATLGKALGEEEKARDLIAALERRLAAVDARVAAVPEAQRPRVFLEIGRSPLYTAGPGSTVDEALRRAGGRNIASDLGKGYAPFSRELVMARDPDLVLVLTGETGGEGAKAFAAEPGFAGIGAVKRGQVYDSINPNLLVHENQRLIDGIEALADLLHGGRAEGQAGKPGKAAGSAVGGTATGER